MEYTGGNNIGVKQALKDGADWIFLLNPDAEVERDTLKTLLERTKKHDAQIANPKIYFAKSKKIWFAGKFFISQMYLDPIEVLMRKTSANMIRKRNWKMERGVHYS